MNLPIGSVSDLGLVIRAIRKHGKVRIDDFAASAGVSKQYVMDLEYGKPTIRMGLAFKVLEELGITVQVDIPAAAEPLWRQLQAKALARERADAPET